MNFTAPTVARTFSSAFLLAPLFSFPVVFLLVASLSTDELPVHPMSVFLRQPKLFFSLLCLLMHSGPVGQPRLDMFYPLLCFVPRHPPQYGVTSPKSGLAYTFGARFFCYGYIVVPHLVTEPRAHRALTRSLFSFPLFLFHARWHVVF